MHNCVIEIYNTSVSNLDNALQLYMAIYFSNLFICFGFITW